MFKLSNRFINIRLNHLIRYFNQSSILYSKNYYDILGINQSADLKEIKRKYYELAKKYHPDVNPNNKEAATKFQEVSEAYEILGDSEKRKQYDSFGKNSTNYQYGRNAYDTSQFTQGFRSTIDPEDLFRKIFEEFGDGMFGNSEKGDDFASNLFGHNVTNEVVIDLTLEEAVKGVNKEITINCISTCPKCRGGRTERGTGLTTCPDCGGSGIKTSTSGPYIMQQTCRRCLGTGRSISHPCTECLGKGNTLQKKKIMVSIPAGIDHGQSIRKVINDNTSASQEVYVTIRILHSSEFVRQGDDVHSDVTIPLSLAVIGGTLPVKGLYGTYSVEIPQGTDSGTQMKVDGKGVKKMNRLGYGSHILHFKIVTPKRLTNFQRAILQLFAESESSSKYQLKKSTSLEVDQIISLLKRFCTTSDAQQKTGENYNQSYNDDRNTSGMDPLRWTDLSKYMKDGWTKFKKSFMK